MSGVEAEQVLVVPTALLHKLGYFNGFTTDVARYLDELLSPAHTEYHPRREMENDPSFKQLIPYVIFRYLTNAGDQVFHYRRGKGQGEQRLHSKRSIGVGGHICIHDQSSHGNAHTYAEGMRREIEEEIVLKTSYSQRLVGLINDDTTEVGQVHLGVVHLCDVASPELEPREKDILEAGFRPVVELMPLIEEFESWSQFCLKAVFGPTSRS